MWGDPPHVTSSIWGPPPPCQQAGALILPRLKATAHANKSAKAHLPHPTPGGIYRGSSESCKCPVLGQQTLGGALKSVQMSHPRDKTKGMFSLLRFSQTCEL